MAAATTAIPGYVAGTWDIDATHSDVSFSVRHLMVSKVRGRFNSVSGRLVTGTDLLDSSVTAEIDVNSFDTGNAQRDEHIRSADFLHTAEFPTMTYRSTAVRWDGDNLVVDGELTLHGVTRQVPLAVELTGFGPDPYGGTRLGLSATTKINRKDFGIDIDLPLDGGGVVVGDTVQVSLEIEAILQTT
jgi:polyisoprenoid-binding protein YceI